MATALSRKPGIEPAWGPRGRSLDRAGLLRPLSTAARILPFATLVGCVIGFPLVLLLTYSLRESTFAGVGSGPTVEQYKQIFQDSGTVSVLARTVGIGLGVAAFVTFTSLVVAFAATFRLKRRAAAAVLIAILGAGIASFVVRIYAWGTILGTHGLINGALERIGLIGHPLGFLFFGYFAIFVTMTYLYLPVGVLMVYSALQEIDPRTLEASRDLGAGRWRTLLSVVVPQARTGLIGTFCLTTVLAAADYITPSLVGGTQGQMIGAIVQSTALTSADYPAASALAFTLVGSLLFSLLVLGGIVTLLTRRLPRQAFRSAAVRMARFNRLMPARMATISLSRPAALILSVYLVIPTLVVVVFSLNSAPTVGLPFDGVTFHWYPALFRSTGFTAALANSGELALIAVLGSTLIGIPMAFAIHRASPRLSKLLWGLTFLPFAVPGVLLGLALLTAASSQNVPLGKGLTAAAHLAIVTPIVVLTVSSRLSGIDPRIAEAARDLGSSPARAFRTVTLRLMLPSVLGAALLAAAFSLDEILITNFTIGVNNTVPLWLFGQARHGFDPSIDASGVVLMIGTLFMFSLAMLALRAGRGRSEGQRAAA